MGLRYHHAGAMQWWCRALALLSGASFNRHMADMASGWEKEFLRRSALKLHELWLNVSDSFGFSSVKGDNC